MTFDAMMLPIGHNVNQLMNPYYVHTELVV